MTTEQPASGLLLRQGRQFLADFFRFAGRRGLHAVILAGLGAVLEGVSLVMLIPILTVAMDARPGQSRPLALLFEIFRRLGADTRLERLILLLAGFAILMLLRAVVVSARDVGFARLQTGFVEFHRARIARRLAGARWDRVARLDHARVTQVTTGDVQLISNAARLLIQCAISVILLTAQCLIALILSPLLALSAFVFLAAGILTFARALRRARDLGQFLAGANLKLTQSMSQFLAGLKLAISQNLEGNFLREFEDTVGAVAEQQIAFTRALTNRRLTLTTLSAVAGALAILLGFGFLGTPPAVLITVIFILSRINGPVLQIQMASQQFAQSLPAYERVCLLEDELGAMAAPRPQAAPSPPLDGSFAFAGVDFFYPGGDAILRGVDLVVPAGAMMGLTGASGAGKTSLADLLTGLFVPAQGAVTVSGQALEGAVLGAWRNHVSYVAQDAFLFHDTVRGNLLWAQPQARDDDLWQALRLAGAENLVRGMARGLDTLVGERGALVSGGERQRLALARALLRDPKLIILDEATNAIDIAGEAVLLEMLRNLTPRPTVLVIAHRRESLAACDFVMLLQDGHLSPWQAGQSG